MIKHHSAEFRTTHQELIGRTAMVEACIGDYVARYALDADQRRG